jgi:hypothetical protein
MTEQRACTRESVQRGFLSGSLFFFVIGDANRDQRVNLDDFNILAANFGQFGRAFSEGDFNYDGAEVRKGGLRTYWRQINRLERQAQAERRAKRKARDKKRAKCRCKGVPPGPTDRAAGCAAGPTRPCGATSGRCYSILRSDNKSAGPCR